MIRNDTEKLLSALSENLTAEELQLASLQALVAAEISMRRQELGLSQKQLAEKMGVSQTMVSRWESGDVNFTLKTLVQIAAVLGIEMRPPFALRDPYRVYDNNVIPFERRGKWHGGSFSAENKSDRYSTERFEM